MKWKTTGRNVRPPASNEIHDMSISLAVYCFYTFFWQIRSLVDPPLAAIIVCGPLQSILVTLQRTTPKINYDFIDGCFKLKGDVGKKKERKFLPSINDSISLMQTIFVPHGMT